MPVTLSTPYDEMHRIIMSEYEKCGWWVEKYLRKLGKDFKLDVWRKCIAKKDTELQVVEYKGQSGNRWMNYIYTTVADHRGVLYGYDSICYWECYGSFGAFIPYKINGEACLLVTTSHFWQRLCERTEYQMQGVHTAESFFREHWACKAVILPPDDGETRRRVAMHYNGGTAYGYEVSPEYRIFEIRTYIDEKSMASKRLRERKECTEDLLSEETQRAFSDLNAYASMYPDADRYALIGCLDSEKKMLVEKQIHIDGQKDMERQLSELRKTMDEEQAIAQYVRSNPVTYYRNRYGEHVSCEDPRLCELNVRMRVSECERISELDFPDIINAFNKRVGTDMSKSWRDTIKPIFMIGFKWGWASVINWILEELTEYDSEELQPYKHREFLKFKEYIEQWMNEGKLDEVERILILYISACAFDRGVSKSASIASKVLNMDCRPEETADEYFELHGNFKP